VNDEGALHDSGLDDSGPFSVTPEAGGVSLELALREFGPAAIEDLIPRLRVIAAELDEAHATGVVHGRLHPTKVFITDSATWLMGAPVTPASRPAVQQPPYTAPEVAAGGPASAAADQFSLAAIAYLWMFGRPIVGPAPRTMDVRQLPGVDRAALARAFTRALSPEPEQRFASCSDFCEAIARAVVPVLPLEAADVALDRGAAMPVADADPDLGSIRLDAAPPAAGSWQPAPTMRPRREPTRFAAGALIAATLVGSVFGFAAGYMARPRALQHAPIATSLGQAVGPATRPEAPTAGSRRSPQEDSRARADAEAPRAEVPGPTAHVPAPPRKSPPAVTTGSLLVESRPSGAAVSLNGRPRGTTPLTINDLVAGEYKVTLTLRGFEMFATTVRVVAGERVRAAASLTAQEQE
jgi:hypothetical protein